MKNASLIFIAMLISGISYGQYKLKTNEVDEFEGTVKKITSSVKVGKTTAGSRVNADVIRLDENTYIRFYVYADLGCVSQYRSTGHLKFTDGSVLEMYSLADTDCGDSGTFLFMMFEGDITADEFKSWTETEIEAERERVLNILKTKKLEKVKFTGTEYYTVLEMDEDKQDAFNQMLKLVE